MSYSLPSLSLRKQSFAIPQRAQVVRSCSPTLIALACGEPPCVRATLAHRFAVEPAQACGEQQQIEDNQHSEDNQQRKMRELRHQRSAQAFARVHQRIDEHRDRKSTRLNSSHVAISYAVFCLKKKSRSTTVLDPRGSFPTRPIAMASMITANPTSPASRAGRMTAPTFSNSPR